MPGETKASPSLLAAISAARKSIAKYRGNRRFNEQPIKASSIVPILDALGWRT